VQRQDELGWPEAIMNRLSGMARTQAAWEALSTTELKRVLSALHAAEIEPLLLKGAAIACSHYPMPHLRTRIDTDVLVSGRAVAVQRVLESLGYQRQLRLPGRHVLRQDLYLRRDALGFTHHLDVHWAITNRPAFADCLEYPELRSRAAPLTDLHPQALGLAASDALLHACLHRIAHHQDDPNLLWLFDIHLLVQAMDESEFDDFVARALQKRLGCVARRGIELAQARFATRLPKGALDDYFPGEQIAEERRLGRAVSPRGSRLHAALADLRGLQGLGDKLAWMAEHFFPAPNYMLARYGVDSRAWLPALYLHRGIRGAWKLLRDI